MNRANIVSSSCIYIYIKCLLSLVKMFVIYTHYSHTTCFKLSDCLCPWCKDNTWAPIASYMHENLKMSKILIAHTTWQETIVCDLLIWCDPHSCLTHPCCMYHACIMCHRSLYSHEAICCSRSTCKWAISHPVVLGCKLTKLVPLEDSLWWHWEG